MPEDELPRAWSMEPKERIKALSELASGSVNINHAIPIKRYYRSGVELERMAKVYEDEGNLEKAFFLFMKYTTLFVECLPQHPEYKNQGTSNDRRTVRGKLKSLFERAEAIKCSLTQTYMMQHKKWLRDDQIKQAEAEQRRLEEETRLEAKAVAAKRREMEKRENELALELEQIEKQLEETRSIVTKEIEKPVVVPPPLLRQATYPTLDPEPYKPVVPAASLVAAQLFPPQLIPAQLLPAQLIPAQVFPPQVVNLPAALPPTGTPGDMQSFLPSAIPASPPLFTDYSVPLPVVDRSTKPNLPSVDRSTKPGGLAASDMFADMMSQDLERSIIVPATLPEKFLSVCLDNTQKNIETCGILAAKLTANNFTITHVILPKQKGTPDSCQTLAEEELFEYQDKLDLITVGWIHTHPSQSAFLSSVDLHTHCSYQLMLKEAIAIVCAPKHNSTGIFTLTDPRGMDVVSKCTLSGFHPHANIPPLFEDCKHVKMDTTLTAQVIDLR